MKIPKFTVYLSSERIFSNSEIAIALQDKSKVGEFKEGKIIYSAFEALYLMEKNKANIINIKNNKPVQEHELIKSFSKKDREFYIKYLVFKHLKNKGYVVKTGLKFGEEFRVYSNSKKSKDFSSGNPHAKYICYPIKQEKQINPKDIIAKTRITHSTGKKLLLAVVDSEEDISFYEIDWVKI